MTQDALRQKYPSLDNAMTAQIASEGVWESRSTGEPVADQPRPRDAPSAAEGLAASVRSGLS